MGRAHQGPWRGVTSRLHLRQLVIGGVVWTGAGALLLGCGATSPKSTNHPPAASTTTTTSTTSIPAPSQGPSTAHVMVVMMENEGASNIIGNPALRYVTSLAHDYGSATNFVRLRPSQPPQLLDDRVGVEPRNHRRPTTVRRQVPQGSDVGGPVGRRGRERAGLRREPTRATNHGRRRLRREAQPVGILPQCEDRRRRCVDLDRRSQRTESTGFRVVHAESDRRRPHRGPDRHRGLPAR